MVDYAEFVRSSFTGSKIALNGWIKQSKSKKFEMIIFELLLNTYVVKTNQGEEDKLKSCFYLNLKETFG